MKKILATLLALSLTFGTVALPVAESGTLLKGGAISASAYYSEDDVWEYDFDNEGIEITRYCGNDKNVVIPSVIDDKKVTSISSSAFSYNSSVTSVTIPDSVTSIGDEAFNSCTNLKSITALLLLV